MNDEIWRGKNYNAGEVGRVLIGNAKWESVASTSALIKDARRAGLDVKMVLNYSNYTMIMTTLLWQ